MRHFAVVVWHGNLALLDPPAIVCRALHPMEDPDLVGRPGELEQELELYKRGYLMCECFSQVVPEGEFGYRGEHRLYAISRSDFERAVGLLRERDFPEYEEHVYDAVVRAAEHDPRGQSSMPRLDLSRWLS
jgi:hypothetical protein